MDWRIRWQAALWFAASVLAQAPIAEVALPDDPFAALAALPARAPVDDGVIVRVVDADGAPLRDATVVVIDFTQSDSGRLFMAAERQYPGDESRVIAASAARSTRYAVDAQGSTRVPSDAWGRIVAVHCGRLAFAVQRPWATAGQGPVTLQVLPAKPFRVTVVGADGVPATDVGVEVLDDANSVPVLTARTGADGSVLLELVPGRPATAVVRLQVATKAVRTCPLTIDGGHWQVSLPPVATIGATFGYELLPGSGVDWTVMNSGQPFAMPLDASGTRAIIRHVEPGFVGEIRCRAEGGPIRVVRLDVREIGEHEVHLRPAVDATTVVFRVLDAAGQPMRRRQVTAYWTSGSSDRTESVITNGEGWAELDCVFAANRAAAMDLELKGEGSSVVVAAATAELGRVATGRHLHGEVRMQPVVVGLRSVFVDDLGRPVSGVRVSLSLGHRSVWLTTAADGTLIVLARTPAPSEFDLRLRNRDWFFADPPGDQQLVAAGTERVVLRRAARVRLTAAGVPALCLTDFRYYLEPAEGGGPPVEVDVFLDSRELRFPAGVWDFVVRRASAEVQRIDRVRLDAGVENHDPRFMTFDWQQFATLVTIRVEDADGKPAPGEVWRRAPRGGGGSVPLPANGVLHFLIVKEGRRFEIVPDDPRYAPIDLDTVGGEQIVRLGAGPRLTIKVSAMPELPKGVGLIARVHALHDGVELGAEGAQVWLPRPGEHRIALAVRKADQSRALTWSKLVDVGAGGASVDIEMTPALLGEIQAAGR